MNIFRFGDFGQTFLGFISCICWINDVNTLIDSSPSTPHAFEYRLHSAKLNKKAILCGCWLITFTF